MIYQIYKTCHSDKYSSKISLENIKKSKNKLKICKIKQKTEYLQPYRIPTIHYQDRKLDQSIQILNKSLLNVKQQNYQLGRKILFTNSKSEARRFLHKTRSILGIKNTNLKPKSQHKPKFIQNKTKQSKRQFRKTTQISQKQKQQSYLFNIQNIKPNFQVIIKKQSLESRQQRRKNLGITDADLDNYEKFRRGLPSSAKRKNQSITKNKDFKKMNMKGFTAKISASLGLKQNVSTSTLTRFMNVDMGKYSHNIINFSSNMFQNMPQIQILTAKYGY